MRGKKQRSLGTGSRRIVGADMTFYVARVGRSQLVKYIRLFCHVYSYESSEYNMFISRAHDN